jgi:hypothetical protein
MVMGHGATQLKEIASAVKFLGNMTALATDTHLTET